MYEVQREQKKGAVVPLSKAEVNRKLLHILSGSLIPAGIFYLPRLLGVSVWFPALLLGAIAVVMVGVEAARMRVPAVQRLFCALAGGAMRSDEQRRMTGATYIFASGLICALAFVHQPHVAFMALAMFILGDAAAALVGQSMGRVRINGKTLEGSLGCLAVCLVLCFAVFPVVPGLLEAWQGRLPWPVAVAAAVTTTVLELFPVRLSAKLTLNDNLTVPLLAGLVMSWGYTALAG